MTGVLGIHREGFLVALELHKKEQYPTQDVDYLEDGTLEVVSQKAIELIDQGLLHRETVGQNALHCDAEAVDREAEAVDH